jgi:DNA-directed RNA polymerase specialized sigma24 family protein
MTANKIIPDESLPDESEPSSFFADFLINFRDELWTEPTIFSEEIEIHQDAVLKHLMDIVGKEISRLTKLQQEVIIRVYYRQESSRQIATTRRVSQHTIQNIKKQALKSLYRHLKDNPYFIKLYKEFRENDPEVAELISIAEYLEVKNRVSGTVI